MFHVILVVTIASLVGGRCNGYHFFHPFFFKIWKPRIDFVGSVWVDTSPGRKFALLEGLSHDLKSVPDRFIMSILRGRCGTVNYHPVLNLIN